MLIVSSVVIRVEGENAIEWKTNRTNTESSIDASDFLWLYIPVELNKGVHAK